MSDKAKLEIKEREVTVTIPEKLMKSTMEGGVIKITVAFDDFEMNFDRKTIARVLHKNWDKVKPELNLLERIALEKWMNDMM